LKQVVHTIDARLRAETTPAEAGKLLMATYLLTGMRVAREALAAIFQGVGTVQESSAYQVILDEGKVMGIHQTILRLGRKRFGPPTAHQEQVILGISDLDRLGRISEAVLAVSSWDELLATP
jgi:hypothetical protein